MVNNNGHELATDACQPFELMAKTMNINDAPFISLLDHLNQEQRQLIYPYVLLYKSHLARCPFAICQSISPEFPRFFVEFGAINSIKLSNTYILAKHFSWKGILEEPAKVWHSELKANRNFWLDFNCVSDRSNLPVEFIETGQDPNEPLASPGLSSMATFSKTGDGQGERTIRHSENYKLVTFSLNNLLVKYIAPTDVGYLGPPEKSRYDGRAATLAHRLVVAG